MPKTATEQEVYNVLVVKGMVRHCKWTPIIVLALSICSLSLLHIVWSSRRTPRIIAISILIGLAQPDFLRSFFSAVQAACFGFDVFICATITNGTGGRSVQFQSSMVCERHARHGFRSPSADHVCDHLWNRRSRWSHLRA